MLLKGCLVSQSVKYERGKHMFIMIQFSYTPCQDTAISPGVGYLYLTHHAGILLSYPGVGYLYLTHHAGILLSHPGVGCLYPSPMLRLCQCYPTPPNYSQQQQQHSSINYICLPLYLEQQTIQMLNNHQKCLNI